LLLYAATEIINDGRMRQIATDRQHATTTALEYVGTIPALPDATTAERAKELVAAIAAINERQAALTGNHHQNQVLLALLALFVVGEILFLEYRFLIRPIVRMATALEASGRARDELAAYAFRHDE